MGKWLQVVEIVKVIVGGVERLRVIVGDLEAACQCDCFRFYISTKFQTKSPDLPGFCEPKNNPGITY